MTRHDNFLEAVKLTKKQLALGHSPLAKFAPSSSCSGVLILCAKSFQLFQNCIVAPTPVSNLKKSSSFLADRKALYLNFWFSPEILHLGDGYTGIPATELFYLCKFGSTMDYITLLKKHFFSGLCVAQNSASFKL